MKKSDVVKKLIKKWSKSLAIPESYLSSSSCERTIPEDISVGSHEMVSIDTTRYADDRPISDEDFIKSLIPTITLAYPRIASFSDFIYFEKINSIKKTPKFIQEEMEIWFIQVILLD